MPAWPSRLLRSSHVLALATTLPALSGCLIDRGVIPGVGVDSGVRLDADVDAPSSACEPSETLCGSSCGDLQTDALHCGDCETPCDTGEVCRNASCECATTVHGVCVTGLRAHFDALDPAGTGSPGDDGMLVTWRNLANTTTGDAELRGGLATATSSIEGRRAVSLNGAQLQTSGPLTEAVGTQLEIFVVARARTLDAGTLLAADSADGRSMRLALPGSAGVEFEVADATASGPFGLDTFHTTVWNVSSGPLETIVRADGQTLIEASGRSALGPLTQLTIGGGDGDHANVDVSEILVFESALDEATRTALTAALVDHWDLAVAEPGSEHRTLWLDAQTPGTTYADGATMTSWTDRAGLHDGTAAGAAWTANGLGTGRPAVHVAKDTYVEFARPVADDFTLFLVVKSEDGRDGADFWSSPVLLGGDREYAWDDAALVLSGGRVAFGRGSATSTPSAHRYDDGRVHLVTLRRTRASGRTEIWVDHERVVDANVSAGAVTEPATWWLGRHENLDTGDIDAHYGEILAYDAALDDAAIARTERYLQARWTTASVGRQTPLGTCTTGASMYCPYTSLAALRGLASGRYWVDLGAGPMRVSVDADEGGGWVLVLQYVHDGGTNPELRTVRAGYDLPSLSTTALGSGDNRYATEWGHASVATAALLREATELRFFGRTSNHGRVVHFRSTVGVSGWRGGTNAFNGLQSSFTPLAGHTANLPGTADSFGFGATADTVLTEFPFYDASFYHFAVRGSAIRWEVDDYPASSANDTIHRVWARVAP